MDTDEDTTAQLPSLADNEMKKIALGFRMVDGKVEITITSHGMHDDINEMATFLSFALEKILES